MALIGILGDKGQEAARDVEELLEKAGQGGRHRVIGLAKHAEPTDPVDVLITLENSPPAQEYIAGLNKKSFWIMNPDRKDLLALASHNQGLLVTYGFNSKDCVTASSVMENEIQICIQRDLPTLSGGRLEQQEFGVFADTERKDPEVFLAALTAVFLCDIDVGKLHVLNQSGGE